MSSADPAVKGIVRLALTLTGLGFIVGGLFYWFTVPDSPDNMRWIISGVLCLAGFTDLVFSWFIFRDKE